MVLAMPSERRSSERKRGSMVPSVTSSSDAGTGGGDKDGSVVSGQAQSGSEDSEWALEGREYTIGLMEIPWTSEVHGNEKTENGGAGAGSDANGGGVSRTYRARSASGFVYC